VIEGAGLALDSAKFDQLLTAITKIGDERYLAKAGGTITGPLWLLSKGFKQLNASGDGDFEIVHRGNGDVSIYVNNGSNRLARFTQTGRMILGEAVDNERDVLQVSGSVCADSPADSADNNQLTSAAWVNRRIAALIKEKAVPLTAFTGVNQSLDETGYQVLPGGLILQWGRVYVPASTQTIVALPMTFPMANHNSQATGTTSNGLEPEVAVIARSLGSITLITDYAQTVDWFAIGR